MKNKELLFIFKVFEQTFALSNKKAVKIDYDILDRIIHAIPIDTAKH